MSIDRIPFMPEIFTFGSCDQITPSVSQEVPGILGLPGSPPLSELILHPTVSQDNPEILGLAGSLPLDDLLLRV